MAFHKWDEGYYEGQYKKALRWCEDYRNQINKLQEKLRGVDERLELLDCITKPVLFIEEGSVMSNLPAEMYFRFRVIWLKRGKTAPQIFDQQQLLQNPVLSKRA